LRRAIKIAACVVAMPVVVAAAGLGVLQTGGGKTWLAAQLASELSSPGQPARVESLTGFAPFDLRVGHIELGDAGGAWLTIDNARLAWSPAALLRGKLRIDRLDAESIEFIRLPAPSGTPDNEPFALPRLPVAVELRELAIGRFGVGPALSGADDAAASMTASGALASGHADLALNLTRADRQPGSGIVTAHYDRAKDALDLDLAVEEPTGILLDAALGRADKLPLSVSLHGGGPLDAWRGQFKLAAGPYIHADAALEIAQTVGARFAVTGTAAVAALLTEDARPVVGNDAHFRIVFAEDGRGGTMLAPSRIDLAALTMTAEGATIDAGGLSGKMHFGVPDTAGLTPLVGAAAQGAIDLDAVFSGTVERPKISLVQHSPLTIDGITMDGLTLDAALTQIGKKKDPNPSFDVTLDAEAKTLHAADSVYGSLALHLSGRTDVAGTAVDLRDFGVTGAGIAIKGHGSFKDHVAEGKADLAATDLAIVGRAIGHPLSGSATATVSVTANGAKSDLRLTATADKLRSFIPAVDAMLADKVAVAVNGSRAADGRIALGGLTLESRRAKIEGDGTFNPMDGRIDGNLKAGLADLSALSGVMQSPLAGTGGVTAKISGTLDRPGIDATATLDRLAFGAMRIDHLDAKIHAPDGLAGVASATGNIASGKLAETFDAAFRADRQTYRIDRLHLAGDGGTVDGALAFGGQRISGRLNAAIGDLSLWSGVAGAPLAGKITVDANLPSGGGQGPINITADKIVYDTTGLKQAALSGRISGDLAHPSGDLDLTLAGLAASGVSLTTGEAHIAARGTQGDFRTHLVGRADGPIDLAVAGSFDRGKAATAIRLTTLQAMLGVGNTLTLSRPVTFAIAPDGYRMTGLALAVNGGTVQGDAALSDKQMAAELTFKSLPLHPLALLAGKTAIGGTIDGGIVLSGTPARPNARLSLVSRTLDLQTDGPLPRPALALTAKADWQGERVNLDIAATTGTGEQLALSGSAPLAFDLATLTAHAPANPSLALKIAGGGRIENLASVIPLGEDRMSGQLSVDVAVAGTLEAPLPSGRIAITGGRYADMALGAQIDAIDLAITGHGQRFVLDHMTATDGGTGKLTASGSLDLSRAPAVTDFTLNFTDFTVARTDDATISTDGDLRLDGSLKAMTVSGKLGVRHAELYIPDRLPTSVVTLDVTEIGGKQPGDAAPKAEPVAPVALRIALDAPDRIFIRGHGVTSEWRGHVDITGTTDAPILVGQLAVSNGTIDLLGQSFSINRGLVGFNGGQGVNPTLDVQAGATAGGITANVNVTGVAGNPKIALSSTPALPQDEILARVLFGQTVGSLTTSQGIQLAAAAATLAQGGPGVMDRVRRSIGLDRLDVNSTSTTGSNSSASKGTTVSGGKYIANGVFIGVAQGISGTGSEAKVEVEITPNVSVNSTFGTVSGSGFGAKYSVDY
jgi:translocation and assembly module TamB